ncbi:unnamed protein product, partial [Rotaria magnacalcarata]
MTVDPSKISTSITPFAMIDKHSALPREQEILFTMHTVFRILEITQTPSNSRLWEVQLTITDESDPQLAGLTDCFKEEIEGRGWHRMGRLMLKVGHFDQAEELYNELLKGASDDSDRALIYHMLGHLKGQQGKYPEAVKFYENSLQINRKTLSEDDVSSTDLYNDMGLAYHNMGEYSKALKYHEKSLKIKEISLPPTRPSLATSYHSIGIVYDRMGEYSKALEYYEKSHKIREKAQPANHPDFAATYSDVHRLMGDCERALAFHHKALNIQENVNCNPLQCATTYMNLGETYREVKDYTTALTYYQKGLKIREEKLAKTHPDLAAIYHNMSKFYFSTQKYSIAMKYVQQAVEIGQEKLPATHPHLVEYRETFEKI